MSGSPPHKRPRVDASADDAERSSSASFEADSLLSLLRSGLGPTAERLAKHATVAQTLVATDEDSVEAAITCCKLLFQEHHIGLDAAMEAVKILASLAEGMPTTWRDLPRLCDDPLAQPLAGCDEECTRQLHTVSEVLQFPKRVSLLLQRQLAVFRIRSAVEAGEDDTATLVRAEAVLSPLMSEAEAFVQKYATPPSWKPCGLPLAGTPAFWKGFFADTNFAESLDCGRCELDHVAYGAGHILGGRGLLWDLRRAPGNSQSFEGDYHFHTTATAGDTKTSELLFYAAAAGGHAKTVAVLADGGHVEGRKACARVAASTGHAAVISFCASSNWSINHAECAHAAADADLPSETRREVFVVLQDSSGEASAEALPPLAKCGDVKNVKWVLKRPCVDEKTMVATTRAAAAGGHLAILRLLLEHDAFLTADSFQAGADVITLQWFLEHGFSVDAEFVKQAAAHGRVFQLDWAAATTSVADFLTTDVFADAAAAGALRSMEWLHARGCPWDARVATLAFERQQWGCLVFAIQHGCLLEGFHLPDIAKMPVEDLMKAVRALQDSGRAKALTLSQLFCAAKGFGNVAVLEWLVCDRLVYISSDDCYVRDGRPLSLIVAANGCLRLLCHMYGCGIYEPAPSDVRAVVSSARDKPAAAVEPRHVEVVRWLHSHGVPSYGSVLGVETGFPTEPHEPEIGNPEFMTFQAARAGALELLQVLVKECGANWTESVCVAAAEGGHIEVLHWAIQNHCSCAVATWCSAVHRAWLHNDYRPLALLHEAKRPWTKAVWGATEASSRWTEVRAWLQQRGCPGSPA